MARTERLGAGLQSLGLLFLVAGFSGPWVYGPLGKSQDWGWQPVWGLLLSVVALNVFGLVGLVSCFSYAELTYRRGEPVLRGILKWLGGFVGLVVILPLVVWSVFDPTGRSATPGQADGTFGWGLWVALVGQVVQVAGVRMVIRQHRTAQTRPEKDVLLPASRNKK